jgi:hypothetical protein
MEYSYSPHYGIIWEKSNLYSESTYEKQYYTLLCITENHYMSIRHGEQYKGSHYSIGVYTRYQQFYVYRMLYSCTNEQI